MKTVFAVAVTLALSGLSAQANSARYRTRLSCSTEDNKIRVEILEGGAVRIMKAVLSEKVGVRFKERGSVQVRERIQSRPGGGAVYVGTDFTLSYKSTSTPNGLGERSADLSADLG